MPDIHLTVLSRRKKIAVKHNFTLKKFQLQNFVNFKRNVDSPVYYARAYSPLACYFKFGS